MLYAEDRSLLPVSHPFYAEHLSVLGMYERLVYDAGAHPESMHHQGTDSTVQGTVALANSMTSGCGSIDRTICLSFCRTAVGTY